MSTADVELIVRSRLRSLRKSSGLSLDELSARANLSPSTVSRIETGKRAISLDVLLPLASALHVDLESLLDMSQDEDVVIRPTPSTDGHRTTWMLSRPTAETRAVKIRLEPQDGTPPEGGVHPGHDWMFVLSGEVRLQLGERVIILQPGEAADFSTMTPHVFSAIDGPAEVIMLLDREGHRAHVHHAE
ncbi:XRE family transcriptional regulator [Ornithinimicrobium sp. Arc0846-15]|nr:XRE family transcriptional regulator [Ornithinimicrobium laminariae]